MDNVTWLAGLVALEVCCMLEGHPPLASLGERTHHSSIEVCCFYLAMVKLIRFCLLIGFREGIAVEIRKMWHIFRVKERPEAVGLG
jgi:hypothetical protein